MQKTKAISKKKIGRNKKPPEKYKKSESYYREKCIASFCRLTRLLQSDSEGYCTCITCGKRLFWTKIDGGHFISRTVAPICCEWGNVQPQCPRCNGYLGGLPLLYERKLREKIGDERVDWLLKIYFASVDDEYKKTLSEDELRLLDPKDKYYWIELRKDFDKQIKKELHMRGWDLDPPIPEEDLDESDSE